MTPTWSGKLLTCLLTCGTNKRAYDDSGEKRAGRRKVIYPSEEGRFFLKSVYTPCCSNIYGSGYYTLGVGGRDEDEDEKDG